MKRWIDRVLLSGIFAGFCYFSFAAFHAQQVFAHPQTQLRGHAQLRGMAALGISGCNPFVSVCQGNPVTITSANLIAGDTVTLIPAQGADSAVALTNFALEYVAGTNAFSQDFGVSITWRGAGAGCNVSVNLSITSATSQFFVSPCFESGSFVLPSAASNKALVITNSNGAATGGNGSIIVTPIYTVVATQ